MVLGLAAARKPASIQLHINELALRGFEPERGQRIADGFERELAVLLAARGVPEVWTRAKSIEQGTAAAIRVPSGTKGQSIGEQLARTVFAFRATDRK